MYILLWVAVVVFILYNLISAITFRQIPESVSATSYLWNERYKLPLFTPFCFIVGFLTLPWWIECTFGAIQFLPFLSCSGMLFAGATPLFKEDLQKQVHYSGGLVAFLSGCAWLLCNGCLFHLLIASLVVGLCCILKPECYVFFAEVVFYLTVTSALI